jgi:hypothetical protein
MPSIAPLCKKILVELGTFLFIFNVVINLLDLTTTFIGFSRGMPEQNIYAVLVLKFVRNKYLGAILVKAFFLSAFGLLYLGVKEIGKSLQPSFVTIPALLLIDLVSLDFAWMILITVLNNGIALGFRY